MLFQVIIENGVKKIQALTADTGTGAPVGSIIVVCSNILPSGYLGLGVQYDITNYPALYQVLGTDTTPTASALGLPTLSSGQYAIKATSGLTENQQENVLNTINENNSYSTEEHPTGKKWIDGKPIYRKTVELTNPAVAWNTIDLTSSFPNLKSIINTSGLFVRGDGYTVQSYRISDNDRLSFVLSNKDSATPPVQNVQLNIISSFAVTKAYITVEYTKTTD